MYNYVCDWCGRHKKPRERWIVGLAAEHRGATANRCEVSICDRWSAEWARHPFAVHFCSKEHKDRYVSSIFAPYHDEDAEAAARTARASGTTAAAVLPATRAPQKKKRRRRRPNARRDPGFSENDHLRARAWGIRLD